LDEIFKTEKFKYAYAYAYMMVNVISLSNKAYGILKSLKNGRESFSDVVLKLVSKEKRTSLIEFAGIWKNMPEMDKIFEEILNERHKIKDRKVELRW
jgi:predicted CopG family antitoxin